MPVVPFSRAPNAPRMPKVDQTFLMAAAADLDQAGMLFEPEPLQIEEVVPAPEKDTK